MNKNGGKMKNDKLDKIDLNTILVLVLDKKKDLLEHLWADLDDIYDLERLDSLEISLRDLLFKELQKEYSRRKRK